MRKASAISTAITAQIQISADAVLCIFRTPYFEGENFWPGEVIGGSDSIGKLFILSVAEDDDETVEKIMALIESTELVKYADVPSALLCYKGLRIDIMCRQVFWQEKSIELTPMEFDVFQLLARHPRRVFSQREIYEFVAPDSFESSWTGITSIVYKLRHKLNADFIQTVYGKGYRFVPP